MTKPPRTLRTPADLIAAGLVEPALSREVTEIARRYAIAISEPLTAAIDRADANDPIARQFVPSPAELVTLAAERADPIGDQAHSPVEGIVHRYPDRVLLKATNVCPVYCRFCFRREMVGGAAGGALSRAALAAAFDYVASRPGIGEVIVTGGDPFILSPRRVGAIVSGVAAIPHVTRLRWHTRVPVVAPDLVTRALVDALASLRLETRVALHANHAREFTPAARAAVGRLTQAGIQLLSQSVLLAGVNDDAETLAALLDAFWELRVAPYYLHHGDLAPGTSHFRTTIAEGRALMAELRRRRPACALPTYVLDIPGGFGKVAIESDRVVAIGDGRYRVTDRHGGVHDYADAVGVRAESRSGPA